MSRPMTSHAKLLATAVSFALVTVSVTPSGRARERHSWNNKVQEASAAPRAGAPEGTFPNIDGVKVRPPARPRAPLDIPSTLRAKRNPLVPRNGRRVGDPFLLPSPSPSPQLSPIAQNNGTGYRIRAHHARARSSSGLGVTLPQTGITNVALAANGATASASSSYAGTAASGTNNGDRKGLNYGQNGTWGSAGAGFPQWLQIDFNGSKTIEEIDVFALQDAYTNPSEPTETMTFSLYGPSGYDVQYWNGSAWVTVTGGSVTGNNKVWRKFTFSPVTTTKIRVLTNASPSGWSELTEVEAWSSASGGDISTIEQYAENFSQWALLRQPTSSESTYWNDIFRSAYLNGSGSLILATREFGKTLFDSSEYAARNRSDQDYVYDLYKTYLMREPDQPSWDAWTSFVPLYGRGEVLRGFDESTEFLNLMATMTAAGTITGAVSSLSSARVDPKNQPGNGLLARDAEWNLPLLSLPGRAGLDLGLSLSYSSMVWTRSGPYLYFDEDLGSPSPGFRLGFPTIQEKFFDAQVGKNVYVLLTSGGRRVELRQIGTLNIYEAADSSYLQLIDNGSLLVRSSDGTQLSYGWFNHGFRCTEIKDRNGNYLTINYNWLGDITTITDTLERTITFNYDPNANLLSISQSWTVNGIPQTHVWASFGWGTLAMQPAFAGVSVVGASNGYTLPVVTQVGLHDGSRYNFEYTGAGQVSIIRRFTSDNVQRAYTAYDYQNTGDDCPRLSATRVWAENWTGINGVPSEVVTQYSELGDGSPQVIAPDGTIYKEFYGGTDASPAWQKGLLLQSEIWSGGVRQKWTTLNWTQDNTAVNYQTNPRVTESNVYDASGNRRRVTIDYGPYAQYGLPHVVKEYAADGVTEIRHNFTDYNLSQQYLERRIIGLVSAKLTSDTVWWQTKVTYSYDAPSQLQTPPATTVQHDASFDSSLTVRGNVTSVSRWDTTDGSTINDPAKALTSKVGYNTNGSVLWSSDPLNHQTTLSYADAFSDNINRNTFAYPTTFTDADGFGTFLQYNFDFGSRTRVQGPPPDGQPQGLIQSLSYDSAMRLDRVTTTNNSAYTRFVYGPDYVQSFATVNNVADEAYAVQVFDGLGRVRGTARNHPGSVGGYSAQNMIYDLMGRAVKQSNSTEINGAWVPAGDDAAGWLYTQQTYDWQGRPLVTTNPSITSNPNETTTKEAFYSGCGCAGGEVVTLTDEGTIDAGVFKRRQQKIYADILGRTVKTELLNWQGGSVYSATVNTYNARDQVTAVRQHAGPEGSGTYQDTSMSYDGYGRLKTKHVPEQDAATATVYNYNSDGVVSSVVDARGATQTLSYNARHLLTNITYTAPTGITVPAAVSYGYDGAGNRTTMTDALGSVSYNYDQLSRLTSESRTFTGVGTFPLSYGYNLAGQLTSINDSFGAAVGYSHDQRGKLTGVTGAGYGNVSTYASNIQYRAWGAMKHLTYGNNRNLDAGYNVRLRVSSFSVSGVMGSEYQYNSDGRIRYARDLMTANSAFDRGYAYDHVGRLTEGTTGSRARGATLDDGPYQESFGHDVWGNLTARAGTNWAEPINGFAATYTNNRRPGWTYDADGRPTQQDTLQTTYDAAGHRIRTFDSAPRGRYTAGLTITQDYDGDGQRVKQQQNTSTPTYYVRSSVVGGDVLTEVVPVSGTPVKTVGYVYAAGQLLAKQEANEVRWVHVDPRTDNEWHSNNAGGYWGIAQVDPLGVDAGFFPPPPEPPEPSPESDLIYPKYADMFNGSTGCTLDGAMVSCDLVGGMPEDSSYTLPPGVSTIQIVINHNTGNLHIRGTSFFIDANTGNLHSSRNRSWVEDKGSKVTDPGKDPIGETEDGDPIYGSATNQDGLGHWEYAVFWSPQNPAQPQSGTGTHTQAGDCGYIRANLLGDPRNRSALNDAWNRSQSGTSSAHEVGGLLGQVIDEGQPYQKDIVINQTYTAPSTSPAGALQGFTNWARGQITNNSNTIAFGYWYHTHPFNIGDIRPDTGARQTLDPRIPSGNDAGVSRDLGGLRGVIVTRTSVVVFDPSGKVRCQFRR